ncbi:hypothetical protein PTTG_06169 [Puccinia triticina 1-1 BBBD Race 1]|uniref:OPT family small oligopeptide transporter n=2 Tax=Puccinia triticina TaxID=208348 RepID=A0A180GB19_PUCT1|nr:uncharacterized protein PtA15_2A686 [Puccinia triticina]OAV89875.1 hypothetical protein PTTG_06169 [Puccinia triticina 1-1 BBBD Race 1]WAQ82369.1 hypothetical protein PtA15_2A686 [Puccinia triticina]WAR53224.1 hypothetical protein PtB15_2B655 [Puccinia triticina]
MDPLINASRPQKTIADPAENDYARSSPPSSSIQNTFPLLPDSIISTTAAADIFEENAFSSPKIETLSLSDRGIDLPSTSPVTSVEANQKARNSILEDKIGTLPLQDDVPEGPTMTVRSVVSGVILAAFAVSVTQLFMFKPVHMTIKMMFLQIASVILGRGFALIPGPEWWNPGPYTLKETAFSALIGNTAGIGALAAEMIVVYDLYFDQEMNFGVAFGILISSQLIGFGWAGLLMPILVYPKRTVFPDTLPSVSLLNSLFSVGDRSDDQVKFFKKAFLAVGIYWTMIGGLGPLYMPLNTQVGVKILNSLELGYGGPNQVNEHPSSFQIHQLFAWVISTLAFFLVYSKSWFGGGFNQKFPFLSASLFTADGKPYPYRHAVNPDGTANVEFIEKTGLPFFTGTYYLVQVLLSLALTSSVSHAVLQNYRLIGSLFKKSKSSEEIDLIDPHRIACLKYKDFPLWGFAVISIVAVGLAFGMSAVGNSGISIPALIIALISSFLLTLGTGFIFAITGFLVRLSTGVQTLGGLLFPGNAFGSMWFTIYGATSALQGLNMLRNMKYGQYVQLPQKLVVYSQLIGCTVGSLFTLVVMKAILKNQREVLLSPHGNGVFSGAEIAAFHARAVSWGMLIGFFLPIPFFVAHKFWPRFKFNLSVDVMHLVQVAYAGEPVRIAIGLASQLWARRYRAQWFNKYNYILSAALDGGTELVVFILAMAFQGGGGPPVKFPTYFLNPPMSIPRDYCYVESVDAHGSG